MASSRYYYHKVLHFGGCSSPRSASVDFILINCSNSFQNTDAFELKLSDFHNLTFSVLKQHFPIQKPEVIIHRPYKNACNDYFYDKT